MKKKIILMLSIMALAVCMFALSVSATNYVHFTDENNDLVPGSSYFELFTNNYDGSTNVLDVPGDTFGFFVFTDSDESNRVFGIFNVERWCEIMANVDASTLEGFSNGIQSASSNGYISPVSYMADYLKDTEGYLSPVFEAYNAAVAELNTPTYEQGKADGVTEYKESEEYTTALNEQYTEGKADGIEYFKTSTEYTGALETQYKLGQSEGVTNYLKSNEYEKALQTEYDEGYTKGVADTEVTAGESKNDNTFIGVLAVVLVVLAGYYFYTFFAKKRRR